MLIGCFAHKSFASNPSDTNDFYRGFDGKRHALPLIANQMAVWYRGDISYNEKMNALQRFGLSVYGIRSTGLANISLAVFKRPTADREVFPKASVISKQSSSQIGYWSPVFLGKANSRLIVPQEILLRFRPDQTPQTARRFLKNFPMLKVESETFGEMRGCYLARVAMDNGFEVLALANHLAERPEIQWAEPNMIMMGYTLNRTEEPALSTQKPPPSLHLVPNDPEFDECWGLRNTRQFSGSVADVDIDAEEAWDISTGDPEVQVLIIDTGILDHPDLNYLPGADLTGEGVAGEAVNDFDNHGTAIAGVVSAILNNEIGLVGVAPSCPSVSARTFISVTSGGQWTSMASWTVDALAFAESEGIRITNNSNSYGFMSSAIADKYAETRNNGMIHFSSVGNSGAEGITYPGSLPSVNAVVALDWNGAKASFSNFGEGVTFSAPGRSIYTADRPGRGGSNSTDYAFRNGSSFACPFAAGIAALVLSVNSALTSQQVESILQQTARDLGDSGFDTTFGWGLVNAKDAMLLAQSMLPSPTPSPSGPTFTPTPAPSSTITPTPSPSSSMSPTLAPTPRLTISNGLLVY